MMTKMSCVGGKVEPEERQSYYAGLHGVVGSEDRTPTLIVLRLWRTSKGSRISIKAIT